MDVEKRGDVYRLLSRLYYLPGEHTAGQVTELAGVLETIYPEAAERLARLGGDTDIEELTIDFSRLFVGPFKLLAPPYGSVYLETGRRVMGDSTIDARNRYREAGLILSDSMKEAPDHVAIELEFMYYLVFNENQARANSDDEAVLASLTMQREFLGEHLGAWAWHFAEKVEKHASTEFYKLLARVTGAFVQKDKAALLRESISERSPGQLVD